MINTDTNQCDSERAGYYVAWGSKLRACCHEHAQQLLVLGNVIGSPVDAQPIITETPCYMAKQEDYKKGGINNGKQIK